MRLGRHEGTADTPACVHRKNFISEASVMGKVLFTGGSVN